MNEENEQELEQRKKRAVEFLLRQRMEYKRVDQFNVRECAMLLNKTNIKDVYVYMNKLVEQGMFESGTALDPTTNRPTKVYWAKECE